MRAEVPRSFKAKSKVGLKYLELKKNKIKLRIKYLQG